MVLDKIKDDVIKLSVLFIIFFDRKKIVEA